MASKESRCVDMEKDFLVLPLDLTKIETHEEAVQTVLNHFSKVGILSPLTRKFENTDRPYRKTRQYQ